MAPGGTTAGVDAHGDTGAREQRLVRIDAVKLEAYRQTLDDLDPSAGRVLQRQDSEIRSGARPMLTTCALNVRWGHRDRFRRKFASIRSRCPTSARTPMLQD